jgi:hypothetical protein
MHIKKYIIGVRTDRVYYNILQYNHIDMLVLFLGLTFLYENPENGPYTFEKYKKQLFEPDGYLSAEKQDQYEYSTTTEIDPEFHNIRIASQYTWENKNIPKLMEYFPEYTKEQLKEHEYRMSIDNYLEILKTFLDFYEAKVPYIILYEDNLGKVHCKEYHPTQEEKESNWKAVPSTTKDI